jgi:hypothetical protein
VMAMGDGSKIFENRFEPEIGSGIEIFRHRDIEIFNNEFHIQASSPSCEYNDNLSTNAIRMADYGATAGSPEGCLGNRVYNNKFFITGRKYEKYPDFIPVATAFFYSASAGDNEIFGNDIIIDQKNPRTDAVACAFYIGNSRGGKIYNNHIRSNASPIWVASSYGRAEDTELRGNRIEKTQNTTFNFKPIRMGSYEQPDFLAFGTKFRSNEFSGFDFAIDATNQHHVYSVYWTLSITLHDKSGKLLPGQEIKVLDRNGKEVARRQSDNHGCMQLELLEYEADGDARKYSAPYTVIAGKKKLDTGLARNTVADIIM